ISYQRSCLADPILFLVGLKSSWDYEMAFRNFMYAETDGDLSFLPKDPSANFGTGSSFVSINTKPLVVKAVPIDQPAENTADSEHSRHREEYNDNASHLKVSAITPLAWKNHLDNQLDVELLDLHDRCYAKQAVVDNVVNRSSRELLKVIDQIRTECDLIKEREKSRDHECEELKAKCEAAMADFDKNLAVNVLRENVVSLSEEVKEHRANLDRMLLESQKWSNYQVSLLTLESKAFEEVAKINKPFDITKVKGYMSSYKQEHMRAGNELVTVTFPFLAEVVTNPHASIEVLLSKKPCVLQRPAPTKTHVPASSVPSLKATPSPALMFPL
nr:hypothetical protein [Tanacetum cinerariifolium]